MPTRMVLVNLNACTQLAGFSVLLRCQAAINAEKVVVPIPADFVLPESVHELVRQLTQTIYRQGDERSKARAAICTTYARCIADDFYTARDMLLMSHLQARAPPFASAPRIMLARSRLHRHAKEPRMARRRRVCDAMVAQHCRCIATQGNKTEVGLSHY